MRSSKELTNLFFSELHSYNNTNFKTIANADLTKQDATVHKAFSSVVTRYFIFREKHPEVTEVEHQILYFKLKLDLIANYFAEFPDTSTDNLVAFQLELKRYIKETKRSSKKEGDENDNDTSKEQESTLSNIGLEPDNEVQIEQQQGSVSVAS
jgi:hypothetical protein